MARRLSDEEGYPAGARNWGRLALFGLLPLALALAGAVWLGVYIDAHYFRRELSQEQRAAVAVGASERPKSPIKIDMTSAQEWCAGVIRADIDGRTLRLYAKNDCRNNLKGMDWHYEMLGPDGTILHHDYRNQMGVDDCSTPRRKGDTAECVFEDRNKLPNDDRTATLRVWTVPYRDE